MPSPWHSRTPSLQGATGSHRYPRPRTRGDERAQDIHTTPHRIHQTGGHYRVQRESRKRLIETPNHDSKSSHPPPTTCLTDIKGMSRPSRVDLPRTIQPGPPCLRALGTVPCMLGTCTLCHLRAIDTISHPEVTLPQQTLLGFQRPLEPTQSPRTQEQSPRPETAAARPADQPWIPCRGRLSS